MNRLERFSTVFFVAGFLFFLAATAALGLFPALYDQGAMKPLTEVFPDIPEEFAQYYSSLDEYHDALRTGRDIYIKEACWHCHSQYVRPVGNESSFYGNVSTVGEYNNELNLPQLFGTRRVGPDLTREAGIKTNDWHIAHFYRPKNTVPDSVMPNYGWYYDESGDVPKPKKELIALVAYVQSLGAPFKDVNRSSWDVNEITMPPVQDM